MASADRKMERGHREGGLMVVVLITGGTGFIGSMLARQLIKQHYSVYIATHRDDFDRNRVEGAKYVTMSSDVYAVVLLYQLPCKHASYEPCPSSNENDYHQTTFSMTSFHFPIS